MADYCVSCKFATKESSREVYCSKWGKWVDKYGTCRDYVWKNARFQLLPNLFRLLFHFPVGQLDKE